MTTRQTRFERRVLRYDSLEHLPIYDETEVISLRETKFILIKKYARGLNKKQRSLFNLLTKNTPISEICKKLNICNKTYYNILKSIVRHIKSKLNFF